MVDFAFQERQALLNHISLNHEFGRLMGPMHQLRDKRREQSGKVNVIPFMINHLNSGAQRETDLVV